MTSPVKNKKRDYLDLEADLPITPEDLSALKRLSSHPNITLEEYIDFLEDIGAFETPKPPPVIFSELFSLF